MMLHQIVEHGKGHVGAQGAGTVTQQQGSVHHLANLTALNNQGCLHTLTHANQVVVNSTHSQQRWDSGMRLVEVAIAQNNIVHALIYAGFGLMAEVIESLSKTFLTFSYLEYDG